MELWNKLRSVPESATKKYKRAGGFGGTQINPQWRLLRMTEVFGPVGVGWGYEVERVWSETIDGKTIAFAQVEAWYETERDGPNRTGQQVGGTDMTRTPDEAYKMAITDALGKCLAQIGLGADIYLGEFESGIERYDDTLTPDQIVELETAIAESGSDLAKLLGVCKAPSVADIKLSQVGIVESLIAKKGAK